METSLLVAEFMQSELLNSFIPTTMQHRFLPMLCNNKYYCLEIQHQYLAITWWTAEQRNKRM